LSFDSIFADDGEKRHAPRADQYESVSGYVVDHGPVYKVLTLNPGLWKEDDKLSMEHGNY
jgi:hypothetical protein